MGHPRGPENRLNQHMTSDRKLCAEKTTAVIVDSEAKKEYQLNSKGSGMTQAAILK